MGVIYSEKLENKAFDWVKIGMTQNCPSRYLNQSSIQGISTSTFIGN